MFLRNEKQMKKEQSANAQQLTCSYCSSDVTYPVIFKVNTPAGPRYYHQRCAMNLVYALLTVASGQTPDPEKNKLGPLE